MRLIDADKLIDYFYYGIDDKPIIDGISDRKIIDIIKNQPTAYSVEKVVDELEKLAEYEDLEEQGLLLRLPVKAGDTIYYIEDNEINKFVVYSFDIRPLQQFVCNYEGIGLNFKNFGKTVFLTQAEAEQKLKEMESD